LSRPSYLHCCHCLGAAYSLSCVTFGLSYGIEHGDDVPTANLLNLEALTVYAPPGEGDTASIVEAKRSINSSDISKLICAAPQRHS
jgi:hypothetical protein